MSRSNSLIISAACHVSTLRHAHSSSRIPTKLSLESNADDWAYNATSAISAVVDEHIELQPLMPVARRTAAALSCSTAASEQAQIGAAAENIQIAETRVSAHNSTMIDDQTAQPILPSLSTCRANSDSADQHSDITAASESSQGVGDHPFLLYRRISGIVTADDVIQNSNTHSDRSTAYSGHADAVESDADTELQRLITSAPADGHDSRRIARSSDADDGEDRLQAARSLEDGPVFEEDDGQFRIRLSRSRIRWGVVRMPEDFYMQFPDLEDGAKPGHLTFGTEEQGVAPPNPGYFYA